MAVLYMNLEKSSGIEWRSLLYQEILSLLDEMWYDTRYDYT